MPFVSRTSLLEVYISFYLYITLLKHKATSYYQRSRRLIQNTHWYIQSLLCSFYLFSYFLNFDFVILVSGSVKSFHAHENSSGRYLEISFFDQDVATLSSTLPKPIFCLKMFLVSRKALCMSGYSIHGTTLYVVFLSSTLCAYMDIPVSK